MVYFVGAGPGAPDLITVRGKEILERADVIIYAGSLVNPKLLEYKKEGCAVYDSAAMTLEEVIAVVLAAESQGKMTARLHTGDPSLYGAIHEQMALLTEKGIEYAVVPGVSSFLGAAASLQAEFTLPGISQTLIVTRMAGRTPVPEKEEIARLAAHNASMAIFLSTGMLEQLAESLIKGGYTEQTRAAIVYKATWPEEKIIRTCVGDLAAEAAKAGINKTALIFVGEFLGEEYERSLLYHPAFSHEFRTGTGE